MKAADRSKANQPGIPIDSLDNQLKEWLLVSRRATIDLSGGIKNCRLQLKEMLKNNIHKSKRLWIFYKIKKSIPLT